MASAEPAKSSQRKGTELEKFKRRMIRSVARRIKEKKSDEELWEEMKKEIGSNCKKLWTRMRMLTLKKLKRLLEADDRAELIGPVARMTLTDWLLFDLVIVHEKIDVIGREMLTNEKNSTVLNNLFSLVQRFEIEGRRGENLAEAWTAATVYYNSKGHQCSPMMLQRRWFQLKELTRHKFYKFWFNYRGNQRQLIAAKQDSPDDLQKAIALRYPQIITKKFLTWEEGIAERLVILPDELGVKMRQRNLMKPSDTSAPDVVLIEPHVETIDLGNISDSDDEDEQTDVCDTQPVVKVKSEPIDVDENVKEQEFQIPPEKGSEFEEEIERLQMVEENFDEASHNAEDSEDVVMDPGLIDSIDSPSNANETEKTNEDTNLNVPDSENSQTDIANVSEDNVVSNADDGVILLDDEDESNPKENSTEHTEPAITSNAEETVIDVNTEEIMEKESDGVIAEISSVTSVGIKVENINDVIESRTDDAEMLPVISTVSSAGIKVEQDIEMPKEMSIDNVSITNLDESINQSDVTEALPVISTISSKGVKVEIEIEPINKKEDIINSPEPEIVDKPTDSIVDNDETKDEDFDDGHIFIADDGIQFADDGIAYVDDDEDDIITLKDQPSSVVNSEAESKLTDDEEQIEESDQEQADAQKFDLKLLMHPVVYTTKLDKMPVFDDDLEYTQVYNKESIDKIEALSKPYSKQSVTGSEQVIVTEQTETNVDNNVIEINDSALSDDDLFNNEVENADSDNESIIDDSKRVKLSSYMLQKPKHRSYNPVLLCKNPDFNTRLKKLTVGFFMSARNRTLLQSCIPMTIDMSKAFEDKLIDGTLYLKNTPKDATLVHKQDVEVTSAALVKPTTVQQSLMSIDDTLENELKQRMAERVRAINLPDISQVRRLNQHLLTAEVTPLRTQDKAQDKTKLRRIGPACYIQNLKDDINNLLTKQKDSNPNPIVTEMQPSPEIVQPQLQIAPQPEIVQQQPQIVQQQPQIVQAQPQIVQPQPQIVQPQPTTPMVTIPNSNPITELNRLTSVLSQGNNKDTQQSDDPKSATSAAPKPRKAHRKAVYPTLAWNRRPLINNTQNQEIHHSDALLTIDTLYKMLSALDPNLKKNTFNLNQKQKVNEAGNKTENKKNEKTSGVNNTVIDITEDEAPKKPKGRPCRIVDLFSARPIRLKDKEYCCWYSYRLDYIKGNVPDVESKRRHKCKGNTCKCCCREYYLREAYARKNQVPTVNPVELDKPSQLSLAIESVINNTKPQTQKCNASVQIDLDETQESVPDLSLSAVLTKTADTVEVTPLSSSNDATAELTPLSPTKIPKIRVYTAIKKSDKPVPVPVPSIKRPQHAEIMREDFTAKCKNYMENKERYLQRLLETEVPIENKSKINKSILFESKLCTCRPHISKVNQGHIEINGRTGCAVHKKQVKQNKIIMNKKLFSNDNQPFFVGKGKILLTNVRMPNKDTERTLRISPIVEKTDPVVQPNEVQTFSLPTGVQVVLLPDQTLTYVMQPDIVLTPQECAILPQFLVAIQEQINAVGITLPTSHPNTVTSEVIDLDNDKSPNVLDIPNENVTKVVENVVNLPSESIPISEGEKSTVEAKTDEDCVMEIDNNIPGLKEATPEDDDKEKKNKEPILSGEINEASSSNENPESKSSHTAINNPAEGDANSENNEPKSSADEAANKKSLLSDLMEMSGIMEEDLAPAPVVATPPGPIILDTQNFVLQVPRDELTTQTVTTLERPEPVTPKQQYTATNKHGTFELAAVTSFAELKYASDNNGVFFKLDLDTGSLASINVCIQKFPTKTKPTTDTSMIDLTDDPDISITGRSEGDSPTNQHSLVLNEVDEQSSPNKTPINTILLKKQRLMDRLSNNLKPINLQQSKRHVARILKGSKTYQRKPYFILNSKHKLKKIEAKIDLVDSDAPMEEEYLVNSDDSSDDEPLIKKVKRKLLDEPSTSDEPNKTADEPKELALMTCSENEDSELDQSTHNTSLDQPNIEPEQQNQSNPETNVQRVNSDEENLPNSQEINDDCEADDQEEHIDEDSDEESRTEAVPTNTYPVPTNLVLSGGAFNAHNIPLNKMYQDGDESQDEDCILGV